MNGVGDLDTIFERIGLLGNYTYSTQPPGIDDFLHGPCNYSDSNLKD